MTDTQSKIEVKFGQIRFSGEGGEKWLTEQLDKMLGKADMLVSLSMQVQSAAGKVQEKRQNEPRLSEKNKIAADLPQLPQFLKQYGSKNQRTKFLATAAWLHKKGQEQLTTGDVTTALKNSKYSKSQRGNVSQSLSDSVKQGHCEKDEGKHFHVTLEGYEHLGIPE